jgi:hypothetical protein
MEAQRLPYGGEVGIAAPIRELLGGPGGDLRSKAGDRDYGATMSEKLQSVRHFRPSRFQAPLPVDRLILRETPDPGAVPMDVVFVGGEDDSRGGILLGTGAPPRERSVRGG